MPDNHTRRRSTRRSTTGQSSETHGATAPQHRTDRNERRPRNDRNPRNGPSPQGGPNQRNPQNPQDRASANPKHRQNRQQGDSRVVADATPQRLHKILAASGVG